MLPATPAVLDLVIFYHILTLPHEAVKEKMERDNSYIEVYNVKIGAVGPVPIAELTFNDVPYLERG